MNTETKQEIIGIVMCHGENDYGYWGGFSLTEEEEEQIYEILMRHDTEGCSIRGTRNDIANILFNMSLGMDYDTFVDDCKEDMKMLTESIGNLSKAIGKLSKADDSLFYVLQNIADNNADMENRLVNADGSIN